MNPAISLQPIAITTAQTVVSNHVLRALTEAFVECRVREFKDANPAKGSFILSDVLGTDWSEELVPFYEVYSVSGDRVAGAEMGKILSRVGKKLQLRSCKENRFGKVDAITRYFF